MNFTPSLKFPASFTFVPPGGSGVAGGIGIVGGVGVTGGAGPRPLVQFTPSAPVTSYPVVPIFQF